MNLLLAAASPSPSSPPFFQFVDMLMGQKYDSSSYLIVLKILIVLTLMLYNVFALVIIRQTGIMGNTIETGISPFMKLFAFLHFLAAIGMVVLALILL
jgi:hypothetical protein